MSFDNIFNLQRLSALVNLALLALGAYSAVTLFYQVIGWQVQPTQALSQTVPGGAGNEPMSNQPVGYYSPILDRDLFQIKKTPQAQATTPKVDLENLEDTQLKLKLWGTVSGDPQKAYAVIEDGQKREQNLYRTGDVVQSATVKLILREKVILTVDGKDEVLAMEEVEQTSLPARTAPRARSLPMPPPPGEQRITIQRSMIDESFADMNKLMTEIAVSPNMENGEAAGLSLSRIAPNSIFRRMGLRNGDVLLGINGQQILSAEDAMQIYESLKSSDEVQVQLKRRGNERTILYNIR